MHKYSFFGRKFATLFPRQHLRLSLIEQYFDLNKLLWSGRLWMFFNKHTLTYKHINTLSMQLSSYSLSVFSRHRSIFSVCFSHFCLPCLFLIITLLHSPTQYLTLTHARTISPFKENRITCDIWLSKSWSRSHFHQNYARAFFVWIFRQSQNATRKSCQNDLRTKKFVRKMLMKLTPVQIFWMSKALYSGLYARGGIGTNF